MPNIYYVFKIYGNASRRHKFAFFYAPISRRKPFSEFKCDNIFSVRPFLFPRHKNVKFHRKSKVLLSSPATEQSLFIGFIWVLATCSANLFSRNNNF